MLYQIKPLPYDLDALAPYISAETMTYHHTKHYQNYVIKLNELIYGHTKPENLEDLLLTASGAIFNQAAQVWNHEFYWNSLTAEHRKPPSAEFLKVIEENFESLSMLQQQLTELATTHFGSGWVWIIIDKGKLRTISTHDADTPLRMNYIPLLAIDVWEHAYYIDTRNDRRQHMTNIWNVINWDFAEQNYKNSIKN